MSGISPTSRYFPYPSPHYPTYPHQETFLGRIPSRIFCDISLGLWLVSRWRIDCNSLLGLVFFENSREWCKFNIVTINIHKIGRVSSLETTPPIAIKSWRGSFGIAMLNSMCKTIFHTNDIIYILRKVKDLVMIVSPKNQTTLQFQQDFVLLPSLFHFMSVLTRRSLYPRKLTLVRIIKIPS